MPRFTPAASLCLVLALAACAPEASNPLPSHPALSQTEAPQPSSQPSSQPAALRLEREAQGPYLEGSVERFQVVLPDSNVDSILWSASAGLLSAQQERAAWTLPSSGSATLTVKVVMKSGQQLSETYSFLVAQAGPAAPAAELSSVVSLAAPVQVDTTSDSTGFTCDLSFDATGKGHLVYTNDTHPSVWYATWNGTTWTTELVDGMGFNTGGIVYYPISLVLDAANNPHIAYMIEGKGVWYATRSGATWIRERVDAPATTYPYESNNGSFVSIALDPSQANRPTIAYTFYGNIPSEGISDVRTAVAYRTGAGAWSSALVKFPASASVTSQYMAGDILFNASGTLFIPWASGGTSNLGAWKAGSAAQSFIFPTNYYFNALNAPSISLAWAGTNRLLVRAAAGLLDVALNTTVASSTFTFSDHEEFLTYYGDIVFTGGKPYVVYPHSSSLELISTDARGLWSYSQLGSVGSFKRMGLAVRPTTGQIHMCYPLNYHVMFQ